MTSQLRARLIAGFWNTLAALATLGALLFSGRGRTAGRQSGGAGADLVDALIKRHTVLLTGASGFVGSRLAQALSAAGHDVIALTRNPKAAPPLPRVRLITSFDQLPAGTRVDAVVNLAGEPIANGLWVRAKRRRILSSRLRITGKLVRLIERLEHRPAVVISASAIGWYGAWQDEALTEFDGGKNCFMHRVCEAWEQTARRAQRLGVRVIRLRIGLVLGTDGGLLRRLRIPFELGLGGPIGSGAQWMSWIERDDLVRLIAHGIATPALLGPVNATAPEPVRNSAFAQALGDALNRSARRRLPAPVLRFLAGAFADELLLKGRRVLPAKAEASGFEFRHPTLPRALAGILGHAAATEIRGVRRQPATPVPATCLAVENPATTTKALARVVSPALDSADCVGDTTRGVELARGQG